MIFVEQREYSGIVARICPVVLATAPNRWGNDAASELRRQVGLLAASDGAYGDLQDFSTHMTDTLQAARDAGATWQSMAKVRTSALAEAPQYLPGIRLVQSIVRLSLASEARLVAKLDFNSRDDVQAVTDVLNAAFSDAAEAASDDLQADAYMSIVSLHATVTKYLADQARVLPRVVQFTLASTMPVLRISQLLYGDGSRYQEIADENKVVHPAFCPPQIKALAV